MATISKWAAAAVVSVGVAALCESRAAGQSSGRRLPPGIGQMPPGVFAECEDFEPGSDWVLQSDKLPGFSGRGFLVDRKPPALARRPIVKQLKLPRSGRYNVWLRGYLGGRKPSERYDRRMAVQVDDQLLDTTHRGLVAARYAWELAGSVDVAEDRTVRILIHDRGRSWAIADCLLLTDEMEFKPTGWAGNSTADGWSTGPCFPKTQRCPQGKPYTLKKAPREHIEEVAGSARSYTVKMGGTLDGFNTAEYLDTYSGCKRVQSKFEPNEYLVLQNLGQTDVVDPHIVVGGRRDWYSADRILSSVLKPGMSGAEKAMAIYNFTADIDVQCHDNNRRVGPAFPPRGSHPSRNTFRERGNPVKAANCYYCSGCSLSASNFVVLCRAAGLQARATWICPLDTYATHCVAEAWHDDGWHLYDPELRVFYLNSDNTSVASYRQLHEDPALVARTHHCGFANPRRLDWNSGYEKHYPPCEMPVERWLSTMGMTLRPGEKFIWRWDHSGKFRSGDNPRNRGEIPYQLANGKIIYRPALDAAALCGSTASLLNIRSLPAGRHGARLQVETVKSPGSVVYKVSSAYPIVGGIAGGKFFRKTDKDACRIYLSVHDSDWIEVFSSEKTGEHAEHVVLDEVMRPGPTPALYCYYVKFELATSEKPADAYLSEAYIETDVQTAATALASLSLGANKVVYRDESMPGSRVRIRHGWRESSQNRPPPVTPAPVTPAADGLVEAASLGTFVWEAPRDPEGRPIGDYHIQISPREDMLHPISPNFDRIIFSPKPQWNPPQGWFVKGRSYFWRVRAKDEWGAWSDFGPVWKFTTGR